MMEKKLLLKEIYGDSADVHVNSDGSIRLHAFLPASAGRYDVHGATVKVNGQEIDITIPKAEA